MQIFRIASAVNCFKVKADTWVARVRFGCELDVCMRVVCFLLTAVVGLGCLGHVAHAELPDGAAHVVTLPKSSRGAPLVKPRGSFTTSIGFSDLTSVGYQPVEIVFTSPFPTAADLRLNYRIINTRESQTPDDNCLSVNLPIFVPQGTKTTKWVRYLPKWMMGTGYEIIVSRDGVALPGFSGSVGFTADARELGRYLRWEQQAGTELTVDLLLITPADLSQADATAMNSMGLPWFFEVTRPWAAKRRSGGLGAFAPSALSCGTGNLPKDWRGYQRWDFIVLTKAAIADIKPSTAEWNALLGWALCGGTLVVWDVESQAELEGLLDRAPTNQSDLVFEEIRSLGFSQDDFLRAGIELLGSGKLQRRSTIIRSDNSSVSAASVRVAPRFHGVALGAGKAIAVSGVEALDLKTPVSGSTVNVNLNAAGLLNRSKWDFYLKLMGKDVSPILRRGAEPILGNAEFKKWLIPGVAQPPVYVLVSFLAIFVVLVGPVAYRRTTRSGRGHLMFVVAPLLALVTTVSMFAYGIAADGFSTLGRIRQITWVDGATGAASERIRETYFAPISPRAGLSFPADAEVFSVRRPDFSPWELRHNTGDQILGSVTINDETQRFSSSFVPAREQKQFVSQRPRLDVGRLSIARIGGDVKESKWQVTNEFRFRINDAVVRDRQGAYWRIENIEPGQLQVAVALPAADARQLMGKFYLDHNPVAANGSRGRRGGGWTGGVVDLTAELNMKLYGGTRLIEGRFESSLRESLQLNNELPLGFFVAMCEVTEDATAIEGCKIENSVHYVIGTLP